MNNCGEWPYRTCTLYVRHRWSFETKLSSESMPSNTALKSKSVKLLG